MKAVSTEQVEKEYARRNPTPDQVEYILTNYWGRRQDLAKKLMLTEQVVDAVRLRGKKEGRVPKDHRVGNRDRPLPAVILVPLKD